MIKDVVFGSLITDSDVTEDGSKYTFTYDLYKMYDNVASLVGVLGLREPIDGLIGALVGVSGSEVDEYIQDHNVTGTISVEFGAQGVALEVKGNVKDTGDFVLDTSALVLDNAVYTEEEVNAIVAGFPEGRENAEEFNVVNMKLKGSFDFVNVSASETKTVVSYKWQLVADADIAEILHAVVEARESADPYGWAKGIQNSKFHFMVWHEHTAQCTSYCDDRLMTNSSLFDLAFDPSSFGTSNLYLGVDITKVITPELLNKVMGLLSGILGDGGTITPEEVIDMVSAIPYFVFNFDLDALARFGAASDFVVPKGDTDQNQPATAEIGEIIEIVKQVLDVLGKSISTDGGLTVNLDPILDYALTYLEDLLASTGLDITTADIKDIVYALISGSQDPANGFRVTVREDVALFSSRVSDYDTKLMMQIDPGTGAARAYLDKKPVASIENPHAQTGGAMVGGSLVSANKAMTPEELKALIGQPMVVRYHYFDGTQSSDNDEVLPVIVAGIQGIDLTSVEEQTVNFIVYPVDNANIFASVGQLLPMLLGQSLNIPGNVIPVTIRLKVATEYSYTGALVMNTIASTQMIMVDPSAENNGLPTEIVMPYGSEGAFVLLRSITYSDGSMLETEMLALLPEGDGFSIVENVNDTGMQGFKAVAGSEGLIAFDDGMGFTFRICMKMEETPVVPEKEITDVVFADDGQEYQVKFMGNALNEAGEFAFGVMTAEVTYDDGSKETVQLGSDNVVLPTQAMEDGKWVEFGTYEFTLTYGDYTATARVTIGTDNTPTNGYDFDIVLQEDGSYKIVFSAKNIGNKPEVITAQMKYYVGSSATQANTIHEQETAQIESLNPSKTQVVIAQNGVFQCDPTMSTAYLNKENTITVEAVLDNGITIVKTFTSHPFVRDEWNLNVTSSANNIRFAITRKGVGDMAPVQWDLIKQYGVDVQVLLKDAAGKPVYIGYSVSGDMHADYSDDMSINLMYTFEQAGLYTAEYTLGYYRSERFMPYTSAFTKGSVSLGVESLIRAYFSSNGQGEWWFTHSVDKKIESIQLLQDFNGMYGNPVEGDYDVWLNTNRSKATVMEQIAPGQPFSEGTIFGFYIVGDNLNITNADSLALLVTMDGETAVFSRYQEKQASFGSTKAPYGWKVVDRSQQFDLKFSGGMKSYFDQILDQEGRDVLATGIVGARYGDEIALKPVWNEESYTYPENARKVLTYCGKEYPIGEDGYYRFTVVREESAMSITIPTMRMVNIAFIDKTTGNKPTKAVEGYSIADKTIRRMKDYTIPANDTRGWDLTKVESVQYYLKNDAGEYTAFDGSFTAEMLKEDVIVYVEAIPPTVTAIALKDSAFDPIEQGAALDLTGKKLIVTLSTNKTVEVDLTAEMLSADYSAVVGEAIEVTVTYEGATVTFTITVTAAQAAA